MIANLFTIFDPSTNIINISLNWLRTLLGLIIIPASFWLIPTRLFFFWNLVSNFLHKEFKILIGPNYFNGRTFILISLFRIILINNFLGLYPYIFTRTSHLSITLTLALPLWFTFILYGWINNTQHIFIHLVPQGTPSILMSFIVIIETIRNIIRPGTLAVRLMANIIAGHLLITLLRRINLNVSSIIAMILILVIILLLMLEIAVSVIQAYVFTILRTLYSREVI